MASIERGSRRVRSLESRVKPGYVSASHRALFVPDVPTCEVCQSPLQPDAEGHALDGSGLLMWSRGDETRWEEPPLCAACGTAIGVSALNRWEIEDGED